MNHLSCKIVQVAGEAMSPSTFVEEAIQVEHLLVEPHGDRTIDDYGICLPSKRVQKSVIMEGICCNARQNDHGDAYGMLDRDSEQLERQELQYEFLDSILQVAEDVENPHMTCNLSCDSADLFGFAGNCLFDCASYTKHLKSQIANLEQDFDGDKSALPCTPKSISICTPGQANLTLEHIDNHESRGAFHSTFCQRDHLENKHWIKDGLSFDQQNLISYNVSKKIESEILSHENEDNRIPIPGNEMSERVYGSLFTSDGGTFSSEIGATLDVHAGVDNKHADGTECNRASHKISEYANDVVVTTKRLRKPTRRYIEETSEIKPRCSFEIPRTPTVSSKDKVFHSRAERQYQWGGEMQLFYEDCPYRMHSWKGRQRTNAKQLEKDDKGLELPSESINIRSSSDFYYSELQDHISDDCHRPIANQKYAAPRKHHRQWTLSEVVKLVDGVSQYGVGRWSEIKRFLFSTSAYRTAVDIKDKWRNLLRASLVHSQTHILVEPQKKQASGPIPQSILQRVRELSKIHPYPRERKSRASCVPDTLATLDSPSEASSSINLRRRMLHNRNTF